MQYSFQQSTRKNCLPVTFILLLMLSGTGMVAQQKAEPFLKKFNYGITLSSSSAGPQYLNPGFEINRKQHSLIIGPSVESDWSSPRLGGAHITYQFNPFPEHKRVNFYFFVNTMYSQKNYRLTSHQYYPSSGFASYDGKMNISNLSSSIGYGVKINLFKGLYINSSVGIGTGWSNVKYKYDNAGSTQTGFKRFDGLLFYQLGLGYSFNRAARLGQK